MGKKTLKEEIQRIKNLNKVINELYHEDDDDYLYDPEYYEQGLDDADIEDDEPEEHPTKPSFSDDMTVPPRGFEELPIMKTPETSIDDGGGYYSEEESMELFKKLKNDELNVNDIDKRALSELLNIGAIYFQKDKLTHPRGRLDYTKGSFGFLKERMGMHDANSITQNPKVFRLVINNAISNYEKK